MIINWIKQFISDDKSNKKYFLLGKSKLYNKYPYLWQLKRENVARGVAIGLFVAILPVISFQTLLAILLSIFFRANIPVAFLTSWISNPFTIVPLIFLTYYIGDWILGEYGHDISFEEFNWHALKTKHFHDYFIYFKMWFLQFGKAFFVGLPFLAIGAALGGYLLVHLVWELVDRSNQYLKK